MTWFKVDDKLHDHRKAEAAGCEAMGLWVLAGSWSADNLTDGFVPRSKARRWTDRLDKHAGALVAAELWDEVTHKGQDGWRFRNWKQFQPTRARVQKERAAARTRMAKRRADKGEPDTGVRANFAGTSHEVPRSSGRDGTGYTGSKDEVRPQPPPFIPSAEPVVRDPAVLAAMRADKEWLRPTEHPAEAS